MNRFVRCLLPSLVALGTILVLSAPARSAPSAREALRALQQRHRAHVLAARPDLATRWGWTGAERRLVAVTESSLAHDRALLAELSAAAARIDRAALRPADAAALDSLRAGIARELAPLESGAWRNEPRLYLALGPDAVFDVARTPRVSPCERAARVIARLRALPELLRAAEVNVRGARVNGLADAASDWDAAADSLRDALPRWLEGCREPERLADFVEADTLGLRAVRRFAHVVRNELAEERRP